MSYNIYLTDEDGFFIRDENGDRIIIGVGAGYDLSEVALLKWRRLGSVARRDVRSVQSFSITKGSDERWRLMVNQHQLIGFYPGQQEAIAVLIGLITRNSGGSKVENVEAHINNMLAKGSTSKIQSDDNILALVDNGAGAPSTSRLTTTLSSYVNESSVLTFVRLEMSPDKTAWSQTGNVVTVTGDTSVDFSQLTYDAITEDYYYRTVLVGVDDQLNETELGVSNILFKNDTLDTMALTVQLSSDPSRSRGILVGDFAYAITEVTGLNPEASSPQLSYEWTREIPALTGMSVEITSS